jgi:hypothetical protein
MFAMNFFLEALGLHKYVTQTRFLFIFLDSPVILRITQFSLWIKIMGFLVLVFFDLCLSHATKSNICFDLGQAQITYLSLDFFIIAVHGLHDNFLF